MRGSMVYAQSHRPKRWAIAALVGTCSAHPPSKQLPVSRWQAATYGLGDGNMPICIMAGEGKIFGETDYERRERLYMSKELFSARYILYEKKKT